MMIKAVLFDMIGTTVSTTNPDFIIDCLKKAFAGYRIDASKELLRNSRGKNKMTMIKEILVHNNLADDLAEPILHSFNHIVNKSLNAFTEMKAVPEVFSFLKQKDIRIAVGSGLSESLFYALFNHLDWGKYRFDYIGIAELLGKSRPDPAMILDMMQHLKIENPGEVLKIGDTVADIREGKNAGARTAVVLSGTQEENILRNEKPDHILSSLQDLLKLQLWN